MCTCKQIYLRKKETVFANGKSNVVHSSLCSCCVKIYGQISYLKILCGSLLLPRLYQHNFLLYHIFLSSRKKISPLSTKTYFLLQISLMFLSRNICLFYVLPEKKYKGINVQFSLHSIQKIALFLLNYYFSVLNTNP